MRAAPLNKLISIVGQSQQLANYYDVACNYHDICYSNPEKEQIDCDNALYEDLLAICDQNTDNAATCLVGATNVYLALR